MKREELVAKRVGNATVVMSEALADETNAEASSITPQAKFKMARDEMNKSLIERHDEIDLILVALLAGENPLLVGPPGTGKSLLMDSLMRWMSNGTKKFSILLSKFSMPDEVFGPIDINGLKAGKYARVTVGRLPEAHVAFIDEVFKASPAILNSLLKVLNEHLFPIGDGTEKKCPLREALAASNEWPDALELGALFDRFLLRKTVHYVSRIGRRRLLRERNHEPVFSHTISPNELDKAHDEAMGLELSDRAYEVLDEILAELNKAGIDPGDRRMKKAINIARAYAYLRGSASVEPVHLEVLKYVLWVDPEQEMKAHKIVCSLSNPVGSKITELLMQAASVVDVSVPEEAVSKLQDIQKQLKELPDHDRRELAVRFVGNEIKKQYKKITGLDEQSFE
jgi:MoxR-like ATPase